MRFCFKYECFNFYIAMRYVLATYLNTLQYFLAVIQYRENDIFYISPMHSCALERHMELFRCGYWANICNLSYIDTFVPLRKRSAKQI